MEKPNQRKSILLKNQKTALIESSFYILFSKP